MAAHRYWRLFVYKAYAHYAAAREIIMRESSGGANVLTGGTALESGHYSTWVAANAVDGNASTAWGSAHTQPSWWGYDFGVGQSKEIVEFVWQAHSSTTETPKEIALEYSDDGAAWYAVAYFTNIGSWSAGQSKTFTVPDISSTARYWAILGSLHEACVSKFLTCAELEFHSTVGGSQIITGGTAIAGSAYSSNEAAAIDGDAATDWWASSPGEGRSSAEWLGYDFGAGNAVLVVEVSWQATDDDVGMYYSPLVSDVIYSSDGLSWRRAWGGTFSAWSSGQIQVIYDPAAATLDYDDGISSGGIVFGGEVVEIITVIYTDPAASGGIVFGGAETSTNENHQVDGTASGGIVFGGDSSEQWVAEPNNWVAVKGGTYRISGVIYTLPITMSYEGLGDIAALVNCDVAPAVAGTCRYDLLSVNAAGNITVTAGAEATTPVMPVLPASSVKLNHVLRYYGQTSIIQSDIGKTWLPPALTTLEAVIADDELAWAELSTTITITCRDQYGQLFTGNKTVNAAFETGNGTITPWLKSGGASSFVFTYTRGGNDPGDLSPIITFSSPTGALCVAFIKLLDAGGAIMI